MKTTLRKREKTPLSKSNSIGRLLWLIFIVVTCFSGQIFAGTKPPNKSRYINAGNDLSVTYRKGSGGAITISSPTLSYSSPHTYLQALAITPLSPASTDVAALSYSASPASIGSGFGATACTAVDAAGDIFVTDYSNGQLKEIPAGSNTPVVYGPAFSGPVGVAVDAAGNVYVAESGTSDVKMIPAGNGTPVTIGSGFTTPYGIALDAAGNLYVADAGNNAIKEVPAGNGTPITLGSGFTEPGGVAADRFGNVYVADRNNGAIKMIPAGNGAVVTIATGFNEPTGVVPDLAGNIYVTEEGGSKVDMIPAGSSTPVTLGSGFYEPFGLAIDGVGNLIIADQLNHAVKKIIPTGGYFINQLPAGINFSSATGTLSGTPTAVSAAANYKVTAYNIAGSAHVTISIAVTAPPAPTLSYSSPQTYLQALAITPLSPASTGVATLSYRAIPGSIGSGFGATACTAVDAAGDIFVTDYSNGQLKEIPAGSNTPVVYGPAFSGPVGVAVDAAGNVYVAESGTSDVKMIPAGNGTPVTIGSGFTTPYGIALDAAGNLYVADAGNNAIKEVPAGNGTPITLGSGFSEPGGVAADRFGNVYVADRNNGAIKMIPAGNGAVITIATGFNEPTGVVPDLAGNIYVTEEGGSKVDMIPAGSSTPVTLGSGFYEPFGLAIDGVGNLIIADQLNHAVKKIIPTGGYFINQLPAGINFSSATGTLSGTPTAVSAAANYKVTAYNIAGSAHVTISIAVTAPPAPTLSYSSPQTYLQGLAITPLSPASTGVATLSYRAIPGSIGSGFGATACTAVDAAGDIFVTDYSNGQLKEIPAGSNTPVVYGPAFSGPVGVAVDAAGNVYVAESGTSDVKMIPAGNGTPVTIGSGFTTPYGIALDAAGNLYVADAGNNAIKEVPAGNGTPITLGSGFTEPGGVAADRFGNVYVADRNNGAIKMIPAGNGAVVTIATGFNEPTGVVPDLAGNIYVTEEGGSKVDMIPAGSSTPVTLGSGFYEPFGLAIDGVGNLIIADQLNHAVKKIIPTGGYFINQLPAGINFSSATGTLSGTPTAVSAAANYKVTAYNIAGSAHVTISIAVTAPPAPTLSYSSPQTYLQALAITPLSPASTGVATLSYRAIPGSIGSGFGATACTAVDAAGDIFVTDYSNGQLKEIPAGSNTPVVYGPAFSGPVGVAVDAAGNVYVAESGTSDVKMIPAGNGTPVTIGSGFTTPYGIALDAAGNLYVADAGNNAIKEVPAGNGTPITLGSGFTEPGGVAADRFGNVYVADRNNGAIKMIPAGNGAVITIATGFNEPTGVVPDLAGNIYVTEEGGSKVDMIPAGSSTPVTLGSGFYEPFGLAIDGVGNLIIADQLNHAVKKIIPTGGYFINQLPAGINFSSATGTLSGTPTAVSAAANYKVTAYNIAGSAHVTISIAVTAPPAPTLSYSSPQTYLQGLAITPLSPASTGVATLSYRAIPGSIGSGFGATACTAVDAAGDIFVTDYSNGQLKEIPAGSNTPVVYGPAFSGPVGVAVDAAGNVYVAESGTSDVKMIPAGNGTPVTIGSGFTTPYGIALDAAGNLYVADAGNNAIKEVPAGNGTPITLGSGFTEPGGVAADRFGNVYVADRNNGAIKMIPAGNGAVVTIATGFNEPTGVVPDLAGNIYVTEEGGSKVDMIPAGSSTPVTLGSGFYEPFGLAIDGVGNLIIADQLNHAVKKIIPTGGYFINQLPAGINFSSATGTLSGTPTAVSAAANYKVTAYNIAGSAHVTISIAVTATLPTLSNIALSAGTLSPLFTPTGNSYTAAVANSVSAITVTPTASISTSTIKVNGVSVTSGSASQSLPLNAGLNTIDVLVTAHDGVITKTYTVTVTRAPSANAILSNLSISAGTLSPAFATETTSYTASVTNGITSLTVTPTTSNSGATVTVNGMTVTSGTASGAIALNVGSNTITTVVTAQDGTTKKTYTVAVTRAPSANAILANLSISAGALSPPFAAQTTSYTASVTNGVTSLTVTPTTSNSGATVTVNGMTVTSGTASGAIALNVGSNTITTIVTAQDGTTKKTYTVAVTRAPSANAILANLSISAGALSPPFASQTTSYTATVANAVASLTETPVTSNPGATVTVNGTTVASGSASGPLALNVGSNTITTIVTAQDGTTKKTYTITVTRESGNDNLSALTLSSGALSPTFASGTLSYTASVANAVSSVMVTPTTSDPSATGVTVNGIAVTSGTASGPVALSAGQNTITIIVTAHDPSFTKTYTVTVTRASGPINIPDETVSVSGPPDNPQLADDGIVVHPGVSPNGDGIDDFLQIDNIAGYPDNRLAIMNRNGMLVYEAKGYDNISRIFDGHSNKTGQLQLPGTYFYSLDYTAKGVVKHKTGFLVLKY